jgi:3-methyladenine DNA glycosylase AlkD
MIQRNALRTEIEQDLRKSARQLDDAQMAFAQRYLGTPRTVLGVRARDGDKIVRAHLKQIKQMDPLDARALIGELLRADTFDTRSIGGSLFSRLPTVRAVTDMATLREWVAQTAGWAECDCLCQSSFAADEVLGRWGEWSEAMRQFARDANVQVRRASLVLQVKSAAKSADDKIKELAFESVESLKHEKAILITKAVSWLLRALAVTHPYDTRQYLEANRPTLPAIAYRETMRKITTGKKN